MFYGADANTDYVEVPIFFPRTSPDFFTIFPRFYVRQFNLVKSQLSVLSFSENIRLFGLFLVTFLIIL